MQKFSASFNRLLEARRNEEVEEERQHGVGAGGSWRSRGAREEVKRGQGEWSTAGGGRWMEV